MKRLAAGALSALALMFASAGGASAKTPRAVEVARTTAVPDCTLHVDAAAGAGGAGSTAKPYKTIKDAVKAAKKNAVICVAEGVYREKIDVGTKPFTLAGGFRSGSGFGERDSARYVSKAQGDGKGSFVRVQDPGPQGKDLTAIDGFEITGYAQGVYRAFYISQRFDLTNNFIHDNDCKDPAAIGGGFVLTNVSGEIRGNVLADNVCGRGGAGAVVDDLNENTVRVANNRVERNSGDEPQNSHGGALYLFGQDLTIVGNLFVENRVTGWGAGLYLGAFTPGGQFTNGKLSWNVYLRNRAGIYGGGFFCDDGAKCESSHELYVGNCGGNIYLDGGFDGSGPTIASFDHLTNVDAKGVDCKGKGPGVLIDDANDAEEVYTFTNSLFRGNAKGVDFVASCNGVCGPVRVDVKYSMVQRKYLNQGLSVRFGAGIVKPKNPQFADPKSGDHHLKSTSPALAKGDPADPGKDDPACAGDRVELGTYGDSEEATCVQ